MAEQQRTYIAIDLKSFYASVECVDRGLDPLTTNLLVADVSRTEKTICLAVSPSLKEYGIGGRARLFEVYQKARGVSFIIAPPRMAHYIEVSTQVYRTYLKYIAPEDIHVYSIDEVFMDVTAYLGSYKMTAHELAMKMIRDVLATTGITATAGIGTNMYLAKVAMDIVAKKMPADKDGVRIAELDEMAYRRQLWDYRPITKFWRVGTGIAEKLAVYGIDTMGKVARLSLQNDEVLYHMFGVNAELLIDHAWGWEPCTMAQIKAYRPQSNSLSSSQVLPEPYDNAKGLLIVKEMADSLALDLLEKGLVTDMIGLWINYDSKCPDDFKGDFGFDWYGRKVPKSVNSSIRLEVRTSSAVEIRNAAVKLYEQLTDKRLFVRRVTISAADVVLEGYEDKCSVQMDLFTDYEALERKKKLDDERRDKEKRQMLAALEIKKRYGRNAIVRGMDMEDGATGMDRNNQIGGHKA